MIITVTGKPCSGKGTCCKIFCQKYGYDYICAGDIMREVALNKGYKSVLDFQEHSPDVVETDHYVDSYITQIGNERQNDNLLIDSRLAWHFAKPSFKVFIDVKLSEAGKRLMLANRPNEKVENLLQAKRSLKKRWKVENSRYKKIYGIDNTNMKNYDLVIDSTSISPEELADIIFEKLNQNNP